MREIKFRGKRIDNGEWVYGYYVRYEHMGNVEHIIVTDWAQVYVNSYYVILESVGQFTGLHDKNGKEIYEGDIVLYKYASYRDISKVIYNTKIASFEMVAIKEDDNKSMEKFKKGRTRNFVEGCVNGYDYVKVIGNIYENSKFLESGEQRKG